MEYDEREVDNLARQTWIHEMRILPEQRWWWISGLAPATKLRYVLRARLEIAEERADRQEATLEHVRILLREIADTARTDNSLTSRERATLNVALRRANDGA